jgi:hypothetical protein
MSYLRLPRSLAVRQRDLAIEALEKIAGADYRGNRPPESVLAYAYLQRIREMAGEGLRTGDKPKRQDIGGGT